MRRQSLVGSNYEGFNQKGFEESNFKSGLSIKFSLTRIIISGLYTYNTIEKLYGEELSSKEIIQLIGGEVKHHRQSIEQRIEDNK